MLGRQTLCASVTCCIVIAYVALPSTITSRTLRSRTAARPQTTDAANSSGLCGVSLVDTTQKWLSYLEALSHGVYGTQFMTGYALVPL